MIKNLIVLLFILLQFSCTSQQNKLEKEWILIYQKEKNTDEIVFSEKGKRFKFINNEFIKIFPVIKNSTIRNYIVENNEIKFDTIGGKIRYFSNDSLILEKKENITSLGKIIHLSKDSLVLNQGKYISIFKPLEITNFSYKDIEVLNEKLIKNVWETIIDSNKCRFYFDTSKHSLTLNNIGGVKNFSFENISSDYYFEGVRTNELWAVEFIEGKVLLTFSLMGIAEKNYIQITEVKENQIIGKLLNYFDKDWTEIVLTKVDTPKELNLLDKSSLTGNWTGQILNKSNDGLTKYPKEIINEFLDLARNSRTEKVDTIDRELIMEYAGGIFEKKLKHERRITLSHLKKDNLSFSFHNNGRYQIKAGQNVIREGNNWGITRDKKYIYLNNPNDSDNYIKINLFNENNLEIEKIECIDIENNNKNYCFDTVLKLKLIKISKYRTKKE